MTRKQWAALLLAGLLLVLSACAPKAAPADPGNPPASNGDSDPAPEPTPADPPEACTSAVPTVADGEKLVTVFFACGEPDQWPTVPVAVQRAVPADLDDLTAAMTALLDGPTEAELAAGFYSWFSTATTGRLNEATVNDEGYAVLNFQDFSHFMGNASTSAGSEHLMAEIGWTTAQFTEIDTFEVQFDGSCNMFGDWLQTGCITYTADDYR